MSLQDVFVSFVSRPEAANDIRDTKTGRHDTSAIQDGAKLLPGAGGALWCSREGGTVMLRIVVLGALILFAAVSTAAAIAVSPSPTIAQKTKIHGLR